MDIYLWSFGAARESGPISRVFEYLGRELDDLHGFVVVVAAQEDVRDHAHPAVVRAHCFAYQMSQLAIAILLC